jgi:acyl-coenzyme A synthetase/AMP-(fatty) acid ligase
MRPDVERLPCELAVEQHGDAPLLLGEGASWSGTEVASRADEVAAQLGRTRRLVVVEMSDRVGSVLAYLGARRGGHVVLLSAPEHTEGLASAWNADAVIRGDGTGWSLEVGRDGSAHDLHPDLAVLLSTSGTTGSPKCVRLSRQNLSSNALAIAQYLDLGPEDRGITTLPLHYCYGLSVLHSHLAVGAAVVVSDTSVLDECFWRAVDEHRVSSIAAVPHMLELIDRVGTERLDAASLRRLTVAGGRTSPETVRRYAELGARQGWDLFVMYGQTEATARMAYLPPELARRRPEAIGVAIPGGRLELAPVDEAVAGAHGDDVGELVYAGPNVMMGYATSVEDLQRGAELVELRTGDLARRGPDGLFEVVGRVGRIAKLYGLRLDLDHLERLLAADGIEAYCVESEHTIAAVTTAPCPDVVARRLRELAGLPRSAVSVARVTELARTASGKPDRRGVVDALAPLEPTGGGAGPAAPTEGVRQVLCAALDRDRIGAEDTFVSLGGDSLSYVEVSLALEELLGELPPKWHTTPVAVLERLAAARADETSTATSGWRRIETSLALRAGAIALVVSSHAGLFRLRGGAHVLLAVAGYNFARFLLRPDRPTLRPDTVRSIARIAVPSSIWLALLALWSSGYDWSGAALLNSYVGPAWWTSSWRYWFVESLVLVLVVATLVTSLPPVRRWERRNPLAVPAGLLALTLLGRFDLITLGPTPEPLLAPHRVAWCFVLGWCIARADRTWSRAAVSIVALLVVPGFFGETSRDVVVVLGLLALIWCRTVAVPRWSTAAIGTLAGASLYIYLTHYQVFLPLAEHGVPPVLGVLASFAVGTAMWRLADPLVERLLRPSRRSVPS